MMPFLAVLAAFFKQWYTLAYILFHTWCRLIPIDILICCMRRPTKYDFALLPERSLLHHSKGQFGCFGLILCVLGCFRGGSRCGTRRVCHFLCLPKAGHGLLELRFGTLASVLAFGGFLLEIFIIDQFSLEHKELCPLTSVFQLQRIRRLGLKDFIHTVLDQT